MQCKGLNTKLIRKLLDLTGDVQREGGTVCMNKWTDLTGHSITVKEHLHSDSDVGKTGNINHMVYNCHSLCVKPRRKVELVRCQSYQRTHYGTITLIL